MSVPAGTGGHVIPVDSGGNQPEPTGIEDGDKFSINTPHPRPPTSLAVLGNPEICSAILFLAITAEQQQTSGVITLLNCNYGLEVCIEARLITGPMRLQPSDPNFEGTNAP